MKTLFSLPQSKQEAFLESPLYTIFNLKGREEEDLVKFFYGAGTLDAWCPKCGKLSVFSITSQLPGYGQEKKNLPSTGLISISASCTRGVDETYNSGCRSPLCVIFHKDYDCAQKVGQRPSAADLVFGSLDEAFDKELDADRRHELGTAIGLHAHGVGIGSFVYLRRLFEALLEEAHAQAKSAPSWNESVYMSAATRERIQLLRDFLPPRLVASAAVYGVLSLGIHELSEDDCLANFILVKGAIELILKERHEAKRYDAVIKAVAGQKAGSKP